MRATKAIIYKENIRHNILEIKKLLTPDVLLCCCVKANGYGCGAVTTAKVSVECGATYLAVATVDEGIELRENGITAKIILLSPCTVEELPDAFSNDIEVVVFDEEMIEKCDEACLALKKMGKVFLAIDTGMTRIGCFQDEAVELAKKIVDCKNIKTSGTITHFSVSDSTSPDNISYTKKQFDTFCGAVDAIKNAGLDAGIKTSSSSAASILHPEMQLDMVRLGIAIYGYYPDEITKEYLAKNGIFLDLRPVMQLETEVAAIRHIKKGTEVSYGRTWKADKDTDLAVLPIGYADGLLRCYAQGLKVLINGTLYPVVGRICMDQCMVDIGENNKNVHRFDKVIIFGEKTQTADDIAKIAHTISYEIMTNVSARVERCVV